MSRLKHLILFIAVFPVSLFSQIQIVNSFDKSGFPSDTEFFVRQKDSLDIELEKLTQIKVDDYIIDVKANQSQGRTLFMLLFFNDNLVNLRFVSFHGNNSLDVLNIDKKEDGSQFLTYASFNQDSVSRFTDRSDYLIMSKFDTSGVSLNHIESCIAQSIKSESCYILSTMREDENIVKSHLGDLRAINTSLLAYHVAHNKLQTEKVLDLYDFNECKTYGFEIWLEDKDEQQILLLIENFKLEGQLPSVIICYKHLYLLTSKSKYLTLYQKYIQRHDYLLETDPENYKILFDPKE